MNKQQQQQQQQQALTAFDIGLAPDWPARLAALLPHASVRFSTQPDAAQRAAPIGFERRHARPSAASIRNTRTALTHLLSDRRALYTPPNIKF